jgi:hypothetical protein
MTKQRIKERRKWHAELARAAQHRHAPKKAASASPFWRTPRIEELSPDREEFDRLQRLRVA